LAKTDQAVLSFHTSFFHGIPYVNRIDRLDKTVESLALNIIGAGDYFFNLAGLSLIMTAILLNTKDSRRQP
jgi:hypothetical protein